MRHGARNIGISNERRRERVPSGRTSEDTYEMSDDDLVSKKTGAQVLVGPTSTRYEGSAMLAVAVVAVAFLARVPRI